MQLVIPLHINVNAMKQGYHGQSLLDEGCSFYYEIHDAVISLCILTVFGVKVNLMNSLENVYYFFVLIRWLSWED